MEILKKANKSVKPQTNLLDVDELRSLEMDILIFIDEFCKKNSICYWLDKGTLLGAVRHGGFIPWDDDIDIGMLRADFEKFANVFSDENGRYDFLSIENDKKCFFPYGKVIDNYTVLIEDGKYLFSVNIDVNVYDTAPETEREREVVFNKRDYYRKLSALQKESVSELPKDFKFPLKLARKLVLGAFPEDYFIRKMIANAKSFSHQKTKYVANFLEYGRCFVEASVFDTFIYRHFDCGEFPIPKAYDVLLRKYYGDYLQLPPIEKRKTHHSFIAYLKSK